MAARRAGTYWTRVAAVALAIAIAAGVLLFTRLLQGQIPQPPGTILFGALRWLCFILVAAAGVFLTADCLSEEKRQGTLGLLFLTDLRGHDVVLGKLLATSLRAVYGLAAAAPVFGLAFLLGGVTGLQVGFSMLALGNALFFSLAAGLLVSSRSRDTLKAVSGTLALNGFFFFLLPLLDKVPLANPGLPLALASPSYGVIQAAAPRTGLFIASLVFTHALAWIFLALAGRWARQAWQQEPAVSRPAPTPRPPAGLSQARKSRPGNDPIAWLAGRELWLGGAVRVLAFSGAGLFVMLLAFGFVGQGGGMAGTAIFYVAAIFLELWLAVQAGRFFAEGRRAGLLELLSATPLTSAEIVSGHWLALRRLFLAPAIVLLALLVCASVLQFRVFSAPNLPAAGQIMISQVLRLSFAAISFLTGLWALGWFGIWMGLTSRTVVAAALKTILFVKVLPWLAALFAQGMLMVLLFTSMGTMGQLTLWFSTLFTGAFGVGMNLAFVIVSRRQVLAHFRHYAAEPGRLLLGSRPSLLPASPSVGTPPKAL